MLSCKDVSRLTSESRDRPLRLSERLGMRFHLWICTNCRRFTRHIELIGQALRRLERGELPPDSQLPALPEEAKERIRKKLEK